jgi:hypothetical protein
MPNMLDVADLYLSVQPYNPEIGNSQNVPLAQDNFVPLAKGKILPGIGDIYIPVSTNPNESYGKLGDPARSSGRLVYLLLYLPKIDKNIICYVITSTYGATMNQFIGLSRGIRDPNQSNLFVMKPLLEHEYDTGKWIKTSVNFNHYYNCYGYKNFESYVGPGEKSNKYIRMSRTTDDILEDMSIYHCDILYDYYFNITTGGEYNNRSADNTFNIMSLNAILKPSQTIYDNKNGSLISFGEADKAKKSNFDNEFYVVQIQEPAFELVNCNMLLTTVSALQAKANLSLVSHKATDSTGNRLPFLNRDVQNNIMNFMYTPPPNRQQDSQSSSDSSQINKKQRTGGINRKYTKRRQTNKRKTYKR